MWTMKQMVFTFACMIGCFIDDDWKLIERVVDFKPLDDKEHEGERGGFAFVNGVRSRGGLDKMSHSNVIVYIYLTLPSLYEPDNRQCLCQ